MLGKIKSVYLKKIIWSLYQIKLKFFDRYRFVGHYQTLDTVEEYIKSNLPGGYLRFGDGDIYLLNGNDDSFQMGGLQISLEIEEAFKFQSNTVLKSIPAHSKLFGYNTKSQDKLSLSNLDSAMYYYRVKRYFKDEKIYSAVALHYMYLYDWERCISFLKLIKSKNPIFIGSSAVNKIVIKTLFGTRNVFSPIKNAYDQIDRLERETLELINKPYEIIVIATGCSGRILQKRLLSKNLNIFIYDFGSLIDALSGISSRSWMNKTNEFSKEEFLKRLVE